MSRFWVVFLLGGNRFCLLFYGSIGYFSTFTLGFTVHSTSFYPSIVSHAHPLGAGKSESPGHKSSNVNAVERGEAHFK